MDKELASKLKQLVNQPEYPRLIDEYIKSRQQAIFAMLSNEKDTTVIFRLQGQLHELNILSKLREKVNGDW
jgi:hypothetical protein